MPLARDLYDLYWYANGGAFDDALVRKLWVLKVYRDIVVDGRGTKPIDPDEVLTAWQSTEFRPEDIGYLTKPVKLEEWLRAVRTRYGFLTSLTADERKWSECNARYLNEVTAALGANW